MELVNFITIGIFSFIFQAISLKLIFNLTRAKDDGGERRGFIKEFQRRHCEEHRDEARYATSPFFKKRTIKYGHNPLHPSPYF